MLFYFLIKPHFIEDGGGKRQKIVPEEADLRIPLEHGWKRETLIRGLSRVGVIRGDVTYISPCGERFKQFNDVLRVSDYSHSYYNSMLSSFRTTMCIVRVYK